MMRYLLFVNYYFQYIIESETIDVNRGTGCSPPECGNDNSLFYLGNI